MPLSQIKSYTNQI
ncbi:hypothetical protein F383_33904 [Gossypium arboreum]|uniref:Uncharacterized protein n=1 Tax=Gossypium arboreum TaxID=29729 RepID=A0A0B0N3J9_GOSAR|nr:hypothetical protein F383_33904 [Gossypium arboreum]